MFVSTITEETSKTELEDMFCRAGKILDSFLSIDKHSGKKRGFAFIGFGSIQEAKRAVEIARGRSWGGRKIQAQLSKFKQGANATQRNAYSTPPSPFRQLGLEGSCVSRKVEPLSEQGRLDCQGWRYSIGVRLSAKVI